MNKPFSRPSNRKTRKSNNIPSNLKSENKSKSLSERKSSESFATIRSLKKPRSTLSTSSDEKETEINMAKRKPKKNTKKISADRAYKVLQYIQFKIKRRDVNYENEGSSLCEDFERLLTQENSPAFYGMQMSE